jgi:chromate reductase
LNIVGISGSLRRKSYNKMLLDLAASLLPDDAAYTFADMSALPLYSEDLESPLPDAVRQFKETVAAADAVIISSPMYNNSVPGGLKNAIDWLSRPPGDNSLAGKVAAVISATTGMTGGLTAQEHLRSVLAQLNVIVVPQPRVFVGAVHTKINDTGQLALDTTGEEFLTNLMNRLVELASALQRPVSTAQRKP